MKRVLLLTAIVVGIAFVALIAVVSFVGINIFALVMERKCAREGNSPSRWLHPVYQRRAT